MYVKIPKLLIIFLKTDSVEYSKIKFLTRKYQNYNSLEIDRYNINLEKY